MKKKYQRLLFVLFSVILFGSGIFLILQKLEDNILYFYTPSEYINLSVKPKSSFRIGGLVEKGSVKKKRDTHTFIITDGSNSVTIEYKGILPTLFREGQGIIATGLFKESNIFKAKEILAKHDETYMPKELVDSLKKQNYYREDNKNSQ